jgi:hypothetical protein
VLVVDQDEEAADGADDQGEDDDAAQGGDVADHAFDPGGAAEALGVIGLAEGLGMLASKLRDSPSRISLESLATTQTPRQMARMAAKTRGSRPMNDWRSLPRRGMGGGLYAPANRAHNTRGFAPPPINGWATKW